MIDTLEDKMIMQAKTLISSWCTHICCFLVSESSPQTLDSVHSYVKSGAEC